MYSLERKMISRVFLNTAKTVVRSIVRQAGGTYKPTTTKDDCECIDERAEEVECDIPPLRRAEFPGKVRMGFIPEEWFQFFYPKTGVTGPYMFGAGLITYLLSKEIYVLEHEFYSGLSLAILLILAVKKLGPATAEYADKQIAATEAAWAEMHETDIKNLQKEIEAERKEQWRAEGALMLIEAKRAMIDMQLEAAYREEVMKVYKDILQRLDYQVACNNVERRLSRKHMMFWIHDEVMKAIGAEQNEANREKTKADISAMVIRLSDFEKDELTKKMSGT